MPKPYSDDLRERVIEAVEAGASRREAAEDYRLSASSAVRWLQRWRKTGSARAKSSGGSTSPLEKYANWLLALARGRRRWIREQGMLNPARLVFIDHRIHRISIRLNSSSANSKR